MTDPERDFSDEPTLDEHVGEPAQHPLPRPTGKTTELTLDGMLVPWRNDQPVILQILGGDMAVPVFSTQEKLEQAARDFGADIIPTDAFKCVEDGPAFVRSVNEGQVLVIVDVRKTPEGKIRYLQALDFEAVPP